MNKWAKIFITVLLIIGFYYCYRWHGNSQHHEGVILEKCWLARNLRSASNGGITIYLDGETYSYVKTITHGDGISINQAYKYGNNNAEEMVYLGSDGDIISRYIWNESYTEVKEKLGIKLFGLKLYLPCDDYDESINNW